MELLLIIVFILKRINLAEQIQSFLRFFISQGADGETGMDNDIIAHDRFRDSFKADIQLNTAEITIPILVESF